MHWWVSETKKIILNQRIWKKKKTVVDDQYRLLLVVFVGEVMTKEVILTNQIDWIVCYKWHEGIQHNQIECWFGWSNMDILLCCFCLTIFVIKKGYMFVYVGYFLILLLFILGHSIMKLFFLYKYLKYEYSSFLLPIVIINIIFFFFLYIAYICCAF